MMLIFPSLTARFPGKVTYIALSLCLMSFLHIQKETTPIKATRGLWGISQGTPPGIFLPFHWVSWFPPQ